jgi:hypothetical protein
VETILAADGSDDGIYYRPMLGSRSGSSLASGLKKKRGVFRLPPRMLEGSVRLGLEMLVNS